jgi:murein L,D-transpeptidase YcbB/YkuD
MKRFASAAVAGLTLWAAGCHRASEPSAPSPAVASAIESKSPPQSISHAQQVWQEERRFYTDRGARLAWSDGTRLGSAAEALRRAIHAADEDGLDPSDYRVDAIDRLGRERLDPARAADIDLLLTAAYLSYARDLARGSSRPEDLDPQWHASPRDVDGVATLERALGENHIQESLAHLAPATPQYAGLKAQLRRYREMAAKGAGSDAGVPVDRRIHQMAVNMDRWRWLPADLGSRYLIVNIPAFRLDAIENGRSTLDMKVVVGRKDNPTPVLADEMTTVVFSPYWNIPPDIVQKETLPHVLKDAAYLDKNNIEIVRASNDAMPVDAGSIDWNDPDAAAKVRFRQKPGAGNSLGLVKFLFPNHFNVYLHDTPAQALFDRIERDFSHGCVRVERPMDLAKYVLRDQPSWTEEKINEAMHSGTERSVALTQPLPVYLVYFTAWEENGAARFADDVYGYDRRQGERN